MNIVTAYFEGLPPTINHAHISSHGRRFRSRECRDFQEYAVDILRQAFKWDNPYSDRVALEIIFSSSNKRRWDIDNRVKPLQDCLAMAGIIEDDSQIDLLIVKRRYGPKSYTKLTLKNF